MAETLGPETARRVFLTLTVTRWAPVGSVASILVLWLLDHALTIAQATLVTAISGLVVFLTELPTSGFSDAFGRRPVFIASALAYVVAAAFYLVADSFVDFVVAAALMGIFRALDSGPLEAWLVDTIHASEPGEDVDDTLAAQATVLGVTVATTSLVSGGLVAWHPLSHQSALRLPVLVFLVLSLVHLVAVLVLLKDPGDAGAGSALRRARDSAAATPHVVREALRLASESRVLRGLLVAELAWGLALVVFETFQPVRLAELVGGEQRAGALMGPITAGGWAVFAAGSWLAGRTSRRFGVTRTAIIGRALNAIGAVLMGLAAGPVALVAAFAFTYSMHGWTGPMHLALLHREASSRNRATVLSINSMVFFAAVTIWAPLVGVLAERTSTPTAMVAAGMLSLLGVVAYLPALARERDGALAPAVHSD